MIQSPAWKVAWVGVGKRDSCDLCANSRIPFFFFPFTFFLFAFFKLQRMRNSPFFHFPPFPTQGFVGGRSSYGSWGLARYRGVFFFTFLDRLNPKTPFSLRNPFLFCPRCFWVSFLFSLFFSDAFSVSVPRFVFRWIFISLCRGFVECPDPGNSRTVFSVGRLFSFSYLSIYEVGRRLAFLDFWNIAVFWIRNGLFVSYPIRVIPPPSLLEKR